MKRAIIDLGTNTFHLLIVDENDKIILSNSIAAKVGMGGINEGIITKEGISRAISVLKGFSVQIKDQRVPSKNILCFGTSAFRNAKNQKEVLKNIFDTTGLKITVISGDREAELIYEGIKKAILINDNSLIIDIGGGSVEFIICNKSGILWKQSFEIGGQRMMELFYNSDPISAKSIEKLNDYLRENLIPLANACHQYAPKVLIGSSGSFDTLNEMYFQKEKGISTPSNMIGFDYPIQAFQEAYETLISSKRIERMAILGMIELRVDMIVVSICLIKYIIQTFGIQKIKISKYALKEGILSSVK